MKFTYRYKNLLIEEELDSKAENLAEQIRDTFNVFSYIVDIGNANEAFIDQPMPKAAVPQFEPPTEKQIGIMKKFNIPFDATTTKEQAAELIQRSYQRAK